MKKWILIAFILMIPQSLWAADMQAVLQWSHRVELSSPVSGVVSAVKVEAGDQVRKGQVLLVLDASLYLAKVAENQAAITRLSAEVAEAKRDLDRVQELYARTVVATAELDQTKLRMTRAESLLAEARASLRQNQKILDDSIIRAPFDAVVVLRQAEPGMSVAAGLQPQVLLVLAKSGEMLARLQLPAAQIAKLKVGQAVTVETGGNSYFGKVRSLGLEPVKTKDELSYPLDILFPVSEQMRAGMAAVVKIP
jgi:RND family efflux transporter MFP subunit